HPSGEGLLAAGRSVVVAVHVVVDHSALRAYKASAAAVFATQVTGHRKCHPVQSLVGPVVVLDLYAVVGMDARAAEAAVAIAEGVLTHAIVVEDKRKPRFRTIENLPTQAGLAAQAAIRLPPVDDPRLDLQFVGGEPLNAEA